MKKTDQKRLDEALDKALAPPRRMPRKALDDLLDEYDEPIANNSEKSLSTGVPEYRSTGVDEPQKSNKSSIRSISKKKADQQTTAVPQYRSTAVPEASVIPRKEFYRKPNQTADQLDRNLSPAESKVLDQLLRLSVGFNKEYCQVRVSILQQRTGYRSDKTVRAALNGLEMKGIITRLSHHNSPQGDEYRIQAYSGNTAVPQYRSTAVENTAVLESFFTGELNTNIKDKINDDEAFAGLAKLLKETTVEITGKPPAPSEAPRWSELGELLMTELKIAAARTNVSSVPAFLTEHLRRRLWKMDKKQMSAEVKSEASDDKKAISNEQARACPDCAGTGFYYPQGFEGGVARCRHERLTAEEGKPE